MFNITETIDPEFDELDLASIDLPTVSHISPDPRDDYSWLPLNRWDDRKLTTA